MRSILWLKPFYLWIWSLEDIERKANLKPIKLFINPLVKSIEYKYTKQMKNEQMQKTQATQRWILIIKHSTEQQDINV